MADIKIREGSCEVWFAGKPQEKLADEKHKKGDEVDIHFLGPNKRHRFLNGQYQGPITGPGPSGS